VSSSGVAAHHDAAAARAGAFRELVERDHFMWTWVQRVSRERIDPRTLPAEAVELVALAEDAGHRVDVVDLSQDLHPVVLAAVHSESVLQLGCACTSPLRRGAASLLPPLVRRPFTLLVVLSFSSIIRHKPT